MVLFKKDKSYFLNIPMSSETEVRGSMNPRTTSTRLEDLKALKKDMPLDLNSEAGK